MYLRICEPNQIIGQVFESNMDILIFNQNLNFDLFVLTTSKRTEQVACSSFNPRSVEADIEACHCWQAGQARQAVIVCICVSNF